VHCVGVQGQCSGIAGRIETSNIVEGLKKLLEFGMLGVQLEARRF
jgi:hypothetical protein